VKIANTGGSSLNWQASVGSSWLGVTPDNGTVAAGQSEQMTVKVNIAGLTPGSYNAQITVSATDSSGTRIQGSPQTLSVTLTIAQPCSLQVSPSSLSFTASTVQLTSSGNGEDITLKEVGNCARPVSWTASADQSWIILSATSGTDNGSGSTITVQAQAGILNVGNYQGQITLSAVESGGAAVQSSPQTVSVTVSVTSLL
jgi:YbbR domain-containing protein